MPGLFVAVDLPKAALADLVALQPAAQAGLRLVKPGQMHLTLHFIGPLSAGRHERLSDALDAVEVPAPALIVDRVGFFPSAGGTTMLWAGIRPTAELRALHAAVGQVLVVEGIALEDRSYTPHVSLARCSPAVAPDCVQGFLDRHHGLQFEAGWSPQFSLYSSSLQGGVPFYQRERVYPLSQGSGTDPLDE